MTDSDDFSSRTRNVRLGNLLRDVRRSAGLTLEDVQATSGGEIKASALSAYERGIRAVSDTKLVLLASVYGVNSSALLDRLRKPPVEHDVAAPVVIDVRALHETDEAILRRLVDQIVRWRGTTTVPDRIEIRASDLPSLCPADLDSTVVRLRDAGVLVEAERDLDDGRFSN